MGEGTVRVPVLGRRPDQRGEKGLRGRVSGHALRVPLHSDHELPVGDFGGFDEAVRKATAEVDPARPRRTYARLGVAVLVLALAFAAVRTMTRLVKGGRQNA